jgi:hypothetical protein
MPTVCGTGANKMGYLRDPLAKYIDKEGIGLVAGLAGATVCIYLELLAREEHNIKWYTPEELKVLDSLPGKLKDKVKKGLKA